MSTTTTPNMGITVPGVGSEPGQDYAYEINTGTSIIDRHRHIPGEGLPVPVAGLDINADIPINNNNVNNARSYRMHNSGVILSGGDDVNQTYVFNGNLYFNNASGIAVQITNSSALNASNSFYNRRHVSSNTTILSSDVYTFYEIDCNGGAITINLPAASTVTPGRFYIFKDIYGNAHNHNINITAAGSDLIDAYTTKTLNRAFQVLTLVCDGSAYWMCDFGTPPNFLANTFGQSGQSTTVFGSTANVYAESSGNVNLGTTGNAINFNGASYTFGFNSGNSFTVNAATTHIVGGSFTVDSTGGSFFNTDVTLGNSVGDVLTVNANTTFNNEIAITGGHNLIGGVGSLIEAPYVQADLTLYATHSAQFGGGAGDTIQINGTTNHTQPVNFTGSGLIGTNVTVNGAVIAASNGRFVPRMTFGLGGSATQTFTVSSGTYLFKDVSVASGTTVWTLSNTGALTGDIIYVVVRAMKDSTSGGGSFTVQNAASTAMLIYPPPPSVSFSPPLGTATTSGNLYQFAFDGTNWTRIA